jgi:hypothetical protein
VVGTEIIFETHSVHSPKTTRLALPQAGSRDGSPPPGAITPPPLAAAAEQMIWRQCSAPISAAPWRPAAIAFAHSDVPVLADWRLRECDYGTLNGALAEQVHAKRCAYLDRPYPGGESWRAATDRVGRFLEDLVLRWDGARVLVIGQVATRFGLERFILGKDLAELMSSEFVWQEGWEYSQENAHPNAPSWRPSSRPNVPRLPKGDRPPRLSIR